MENLKDKLSIFATKMADIKFLQIIQKSMAMLMPVTILGSFFSILSGLSITAYQNFITSTGLAAIFQWVYDCTYGYMSLILAFCVGYQYAMANKQRKNAISSGIMSMVAFLILCPVGGAAEWIGTSGMFGAFVCSFFTAWLFRMFIEKNIVIKMPAGVPPMVSQAFTAVIPSMALGVILGLVNFGFSKTSIGSFQNLIYVILRAPLSAFGANMVGELVFTLYMSLCWFLGVHGGMTVYPIMMLVFQEKQFANLAAFTAGEALPYMVTGNLIMPSVVATVLAFYVGSHRKEIKDIAKVSLLPAIFNIQEPISFGVPILMNPIFFVPYILFNGLASFVITHVAQAIGFLSYCSCAQVPWSLPVSIQAFLLYGWQGVVVCLAIAALAFVGFLPFVKMYDKVLDERDAKGDAE